jgi:anti-sigma regulatory factor (Ser/Thr protein kinase)
MYGKTSTVGQPSTGEHARYAESTHNAALSADHDNPRVRPAGTVVRIPPLATALGDDFFDQWPLWSFLELGALASAVPCARLHSRQILWEWGLTRLRDDTELLVSELVTNALQVSNVDEQTGVVQLWLLADRKRVLILVSDASPLPPARMRTSEDAENGRGLMLVDNLSEQWGHFPGDSGGKVVWAIVG